MPKELTVAEQAIVAKASQDLYRYERIWTEHSEILQKDLEAYTKAYREYKATSNPTDFQPPLNEVDRHIEDSEKVLKKDCKTLLDHIHVVQAACFLCELVTKKVSEHGEHVYQEFIRRKAELDKQIPYVSSQSPAPLHVSSKPLRVSSEPEFEYPNVTTGPAFKSEEIMKLPRVSLQETELALYRRSPELLLKETFVSFNEEEEEFEVIRIPAFLTTAQEKTFYVVYADQGPEAFAFLDDHLYDLLRTSERVLSN